MGSRSVTYAQLGTTKGCLKAQVSVQRYNIARAIWLKMHMPFLFSFATLLTEGRLIALVVKPQIVSTWRGRRASLSSTSLLQELQNWRKKK